MGQPEAIPEAIPEVIQEATLEATLETILETIPVLPTSSSRRKLTGTMSMLVGIRKLILVLSGVATFIYTEIRGKPQGPSSATIRRALCSPFKSTKFCLYNHVY